MLFNTLLENVPQVAVQLFFMIDFGLLNEIVIVSTLTHFIASGDDAHCPKSCSN